MTMIDNLNTIANDRVAKMTAYMMVLSILT